MKKISRKGLIRKLDKLFSLKVREKGYCELKGKDTIRCGGVLQCAHITTRSRKALRWDFNNAICICSGHHVWYTKNPDSWVKIIGKEFYEKGLYVAGHANLAWDKNLEKVLEELK